MFLDALVLVSLNNPNQEDESVYDRVALPGVMYDISTCPDIKGWVQREVSTSPQTPWVGGVESELISRYLRLPSIHVIGFISRNGSDGKPPGKAELGVEAVT